MLLPRCACSASRIIIENGNAAASVATNTHTRITGARLTRAMPSRSTGSVGISLDKEGPGKELILQPDEPRRRPFRRRASAGGLCGEAVVGEIRVEYEN